MLFPFFSFGGHFCFGDLISTAGSAESELLASKLVLSSQTWIVLQNPKTVKSSFSNLIGFKVSEIVSLSSWKQQQKNLLKNEVDWKTEADLQTAR